MTGFWEKTNFRKLVFLYLIMIPKQVGIQFLLFGLHEKLLIFFVIPNSYMKLRIKTFIHNMKIRKSSLYSKTINYLGSLTQEFQRIRKVSSWFCMPISNCSILYHPRLDLYTISPIDHVIPKKANPHTGS